MMAMKENHDKTKIIDRLKQQSFIPYNVIGIIENTEDKISFDESSGTIWVEHGYFNYVSGNENRIREHLDSLEDGFYGFSAVEGNLAQAIYEGRFLHWCEPTERYVFRDEAINFEDLLADCPYEIVSVTLDEAEGIDERYEYQQDGSLDRIKDAIINRPTAAIYLDGELASYVLVHEDNSIGYMFTLEKHRHKSLGYWVTLDILRQMKANASLSFVEITMKNFKSQGLAKKTGFIKDAYTPWFGIIKGFPEWFNIWNPLNGESFIFTSLAQLRFVDKLSWDGDEVQFVESGDSHIAKFANGVDVTLFSLTPEESKEAYVLECSQSCGLTLFEVLGMIATSFPERNASLVMPYDASLDGRVGGFRVKRSIDA